MGLVSWLRPYLHSPPLPNTGSLARDLLASERTFLAWTRTGLGFIALGVALEKVEVLSTIAPSLLKRDERDELRTRIAAGVLVGSGTLCVAHGTGRYFAVLALLKKGLFRPNVPGVTLAAGASIAIAVAGALLVADKDGSDRVKVTAGEAVAVVVDKKV